MPVQWKKEGNITWYYGQEQLKDTTLNYLKSVKNNNLKQSESEYIPTLREFLAQPKSSGSGGLSNTTSEILTYGKTPDIGVVAKEGYDLRLFTQWFATFLLQVAINLAPYRTGNLRSNIALKWTQFKIEIIYNYYRSASYTFFLNDGYPNNKWKGFIENTRNTIQYLVALYMSGELNQNSIDIFRQYAIGAVALPATLGGRVMQAVNVVKRTSKITGYEKAKLKELGLSPKTLSAKDVANLDILKNPKATGRQFGGNIITPVNVLEKDIAGKKDSHGFIKLLEVGRLKEAKQREGKFVKGLSKMAQEKHAQNNAKSLKNRERINRINQVKIGLRTMNEAKRKGK